VTVTPELEMVALSQGVVGVAVYVGACVLTSIRALCGWEPVLTEKNKEVGDGVKPDIDSVTGMEIVFFGPYAKIVPAALAYAGTFVGSTDTVSVAGPVPLEGVTLSQLPYAGKMPRSTRTVKSASPAMATFCAGGGEPFGVPAKSSLAGIALIADTGWSVTLTVTGTWTGGVSKEFGVNVRVVR